MKLPKNYKDVGEGNIYPETIDTLEDHPKVEGYNFDQKFNFERFLKSYFSTGFQANHLYQAIQIANMMIKDETTIYLSFTSNMISSGVREIIKYLVQNKHVHVLCTTAGGIEEDVIKCLKPFVIGSFDVPGRFLLDKGINRTGNLFIPNDRYLYFEEFMNKFFEHIYRKQKEEKIKYHTSSLLRELGLFLDNEDSYLTWAARNEIPVYCPALLDGSFGDLIYFARKRYPDFEIELTKDIEELVDYTLNQKKTGIIALGGGVAKHFLLNANIFREGCDYAVYITTATEHDGSDSGGNIEEAITWAKVKPNAPRIKVVCDATIAFPLIVAGSFALKDK